MAEDICYVSLVVLRSFALYESEVPAQMFYLRESEAPAIKRPVGTEIPPRSTEGFL